MQCRLNPVSGRRLPETGIFQISAGDYRRFLLGRGHNWSLETDSQFSKAGHWRAFLALVRAKSQGAGLPGWRRSADRTSLHENSLLSGNLPGNFAISALFEPVAYRKTPALQLFFQQFPTLINRENSFKNREFKSNSREFEPSPQIDCWDSLQQSLLHLLAPERRRRDFSIDESGEYA